MDMTYTRLSYRFAMLTLALTLSVSLGFALVQSPSADVHADVATPDAKVQLLAASNTSAGQAKPITAAQSEQTAKRKPASQRRSFSFHYLDVLEWLFSGNRERAPTPPQQGPNTLSF